MNIHAFRCISHIHRNNTIIKWIPLSNATDTNKFIVKSIEYLIQCHSSTIYNTSILFRCALYAYSIYTFNETGRIFLLLSFFILAFILLSFAPVMFYAAIEAKQQIEADEQQQVIFWLCHLTCYQWSYVSCLSVYRGFSDEHDMVFGFPWKSFTIQWRHMVHATFALSMFPSLFLFYSFGFPNLDVCVRIQSFSYL